MKPVLAWVKSNPLIVVFGALILILLPASWFGSSWWSNKIRTSQEKLAGEQWTKINSLNVQYEVKTYEPGVQPLSLKQVPNRALIRWFKEQGDVLAKQAGDLVKRAEDFNKGVGPEAGAVGRIEHTPLVEGMFPPPANKDAERNKLNEMEDALLGHKGKPNPYQQILDAARAGPPADPIQMAEVIAGLQASEKEKITANKRDLTAEEQAGLVKELADRRLAEYQAHVSALSVYATLESLPHEKGKGAIATGAHLEASLIEPVQFFKYQWNLWVLQDLVSAVKLANTGPDGRLMNVDRSVVKRIVSIDIDPPDGLDSGDDTDRVRRGELAGSNAAPAATVPGMMPLDPGRSITGRFGGDSNTLYDVRRARMTVIVSSTRLQEFLEAIPRTNFMSVTDLDLAEVKAWDDLKKGYYYGPEHVVKATVDVETVWLRSWVAPYMPSRLKAAFKIPEAAPEAPAAPASPSAPGRG